MYVLLFLVNTKRVSFTPKGNSKLLDDSSSKTVKGPITSWFNLSLDSPESFKFSRYSYTFI